MMRRLGVLTAIVVCGLAVLAGASSANVIQKCVPNVRPGSEIVNKVPVRIFCGTAKVTIRAGGATYERSNGACYTEAVGSLIIGLGKFTKTGYNPLYPALFLSVAAPKDGTFNDGVLTLESKGKALDALRVKVVVRGKRSYGTLSGKFSKGPTFTGSFTCK